MALFMFAALLVCMTLINITVSEHNECSKYASMKDFDMKKYEGAWYYYGAQNSLWDKMLDDGTCGITKYSYTTEPKGKLFKFNFVQRTGQNGNKRDEYIGEMVQFNASEPSKLEINMTFETFQAMRGYWILDTDYNNYSIAVTCRENNPIYVNIDCRDPHPSQEIIEKIKVSMKSLKLQWQYIQFIQHSCNCDYS